jgi:hypothetical protein
LPVILFSKYEKEILQCLTLLERSPMVNDF